MSTAPFNSTNGFSTTGNIAAGNVVTNSVVSSGNISFTGNLLPSANTYTLGSVASPWADAVFGPQSITILDTTANAANTVVIQNDSGNIIMGTAGFEIQTLGNGTSIFRIAALTGQIFSNAQTIIANTSQSSNVTSGSFQTAGGAGIAKDLHVGGNITTANISVTGISNLNSNANVKITGGTSGQTLTTDGTGNLKWDSPAYGGFWSNLTQTIATVNTEQLFLFNNTNGRRNVELGTGVSNSRVIINQPGAYNIQFSVQADKTTGGGTTATAVIWLKQNGTAVADSAGFMTYDTNIQTVQSWNVIVRVVTAGEYVELACSADNTNFRFPTLAGNVTIGYPASPSVILTVVPVGP